MKLLINQNVAYVTINNIKNKLRKSKYKAIY